MSTGIWVKQGTVIPAVSADSPGQPNVLFETGAVILSGTVFKMWFGSKNGVGYAESTDGLSWTRYVSNPVITAGVGTYLYPRVYKNGATYYCYVGQLGGPISAYTSSDGVTWALQNASALAVGGVGAWDHGVCCQLNVVDIVAGTWYGYYAGANSAAITANWAMGLATSPDGITWTKGGSNPAITFKFPSNFAWAKVGATYYGWSQITLPGMSGNTATVLPSDLMRFTSTSPSGPWTPLNVPTFYRSTATDGINGNYNILGQVADPSIIQIGADIWLFYTTSSDGATWVISAAKAAATTLAQLVAGYEGLANIPTPTVAGLALTNNLQVTDSFNRANENPIAGNWTAVATTSGFGTAQLLNNQVQQTSTVGTTRASYYWNAQAWSPDQWVSVRAVVCNGSSNIGVAMRCSTSGAATEYNCTWTGTLGSTGALRINKFVAGVNTQLSGGSSYPMNAGDILTGAVVGTQLSCYINGFLLLTATDASIATGAGGFQQFAAAALTDSIIDDWKGGNIVAAPLVPAGSVSGGYGPIVDTTSSAGGAYGQSKGIGSSVNGGYGPSLT